MTRIFQVKLLKALSDFFEPVRRRSSRFFGSRMPVGDKVTLNQRSSYIWPSASGFLLLGIVVLMMIGATNYQNNLAFMLTFLVVGLGLATIILTFKNLQGVEFSLGQNKEFFVEQPSSISIGMKSLNRSRHSAIGFGWNKGAAVWGNVPEEGVSRVSLTITPKSRGYLKLPRIRVASIYPFGWLTTWAYFKFESPILVYPQPKEPPQTVDDAGDSDFEEGQKRAGGDEFYGLKQYQAGEPLSRIDWKSYARERGIYVREFANFQGQQLCFDWQSYSGFPVESRISFLTFLVEQAAAQNLGYALKLPGNFITFAEGEKHRANCLKALALFENDNVVDDRGNFSWENNRQEKR